ncbi:glutathione S-transferase 1-like isoform X2 [Watersipora subatra]|uniref:glutathione S-transferase 1-like isoform X2 n=1 Tax=Watersipora subatra TaxID=2589382 RepID=UPI00355C47BF
MVGQMKLTYFDIKGRAEVVRLLFKLAGRDFIDCRLTMEEWAAFKPSTPKGQLPVLEVDGKMICESNTITRYVARELNLYGSSNWEAAVVDMIVDSCSGIFEQAVHVYFAKTEEEKAEAVKKATKVLQSTEKLTAKLKKGKFILGDEASLAETTLYSVIEVLQELLKDLKMDEYPTISELIKNYTEIPAVADWLKTRPDNK